MNNQDTANKVIDRLSARVAGLTRENAILSVLIDEQREEIDRLNKLHEEKDGQPVES